MMCELHAKSNVIFISVDVLIKLLDAHNYLLSSTRTLQKAADLVLFLTFNLLL